MKITKTQLKQMIKEEYSKHMGSDFSRGDPLAEPLKELAKYLTMHTTSNKSFGHNPKIGQVLLAKIEEFVKEHGSEPAPEEVRADKSGSVTSAQMQNIWAKIERERGEI